MNYKKPTALIEAPHETLKEVEKEGVEILEKSSNNLWRIWEVDLPQAEEIISNHA